MRAAGWVVWLGAASAIACGSRPSYWDTSTGVAASYGLNDGVGIVDDPSHRVVMVTAIADQNITRQALPIGHNVVTTATSPDGMSLLVLATGDSPQRTASDELPSLTTIAMTPQGGFAAQRYAMQEPMPAIALDPLGKYAVAYAGAGAPTSFVQNNNDIVLFNLTAPPALTPAAAPDASAPAAPSNPVSRSLRSYGGMPQRLTFTPELSMPNGTSRRLLVIETDIDVTLLDLDNAFNPDPPSEITVRLTSGADSAQLVPAGVAVDGGDYAQGVPPRIAVRTANDTNVITLALQAVSPGSPSENDFVPALNLTDVGGIPSDIQFVKTDSGLRVAALVPSTENAVLVEPDTSLTTSVALPAPYSNLSLVTSVVSAGASTDVAMLWNANGGAGMGVALWTLGSSVSQPYRSVEVLDVPQAIQSVFDVSGQNPQLKILQPAGGVGFYVLDLLARTAAPLDTTQAATLSIAPDGLRLWAFAQNTTNLAVVDFARANALLTLSPIELATDLPIGAVYDVARPDGGRSLIAVHNQGTLGVTVFDALNPSVATSRRASALILEGP